MQVRSAARPITVVAKRPVAAAPAPAAPKAAPAKTAAPKASAPVKVQVDSGFGSDMLQHSIFALTNLGQIIKLPGGISGLVQALPTPLLGLVNIGFGGMDAFKDLKGLKKAGNTKKSDDTIRLAGDAGMVLGGVALLAGAALAPWVPLVGAGVAAASFLARAVGIWNDETRL
jgi:hypothetical protein